MICRYLVDEQKVSKDDEGLQHDVARGFPSAPAPPGSVSRPPARMLVKSRPVEIFHRRTSTGEIYKNCPDWWIFDRRTNTSEPKAASGPPLSQPTEAPPLVGQKTRGGKKPPLPDQNRTRAGAGRSPPPKKAARVFLSNLSARDREDLSTFTFHAGHWVTEPMCDPWPPLHPYDHDGKDKGSDKSDRPTRRVTAPQGRGWSRRQWRYRRSSSRLMLALRLHPSLLWTANTSPLCSRSLAGCVRLRRSSTCRERGAGGREDGHGI
ncbi:hypothetical protein GWK47_001789 [Chionoecetes opilio]|uniref:Uncharacterized protein n=1 Tax=Chionoecetes opilio TaxID=41210 RepID=A0A8J4XRT7_CHIOP|nr:hypothetical protein GWK47_001789 [Chionoecetes opilio]